MRTTVAELIRELQKCRPSDYVTFDVRHRDSPVIGPTYNGVARVDQFAGVATVVIEKSV